MRKNILIILFSLLATTFAVESNLGGISLGDSFQNVIKTYPLLGKWTSLEKAPLPFPLSVESNDPVYLAQSPEMDLQCYFNENKKVAAISVFFNNSRSKDDSLYETSAGLRPADGVIEMKLIYGLPQDISEYVYKDTDGSSIVRRIYYYPNLCIQTKKQDNLPEYIDLLIVGRYNLSKVLQKKDLPLTKKNRRK